MYELCAFVANRWPASESHDTLLFVDLNVPDNRDINGAFSAKTTRLLTTGRTYDGYYFSQRRLPEYASRKVVAFIVPISQRGSAL